MKMKEPFKDLAKPQVGFYQYTNTLLGFQRNEDRSTDVLDELLSTESP